MTVELKAKIKILIARIEKVTGQPFHKQFSSLEILVLDAYASNDPGKLGGAINILTTLYEEI